MKHLYQFYIGGNAGKSNIEVHDVQFVICKDYQQAIPTLKQLWFGDADKIHIDGWQKITWADAFILCQCGRLSKGRIGRVA